MRLPDSFSAEPARTSDAAEIAAAIAASQAADGGEAEMTVEELVSDWSGVDLASESIVIRDPSGAVAGYADIDNRANLIVSVYAYVPPAFRGRGVGTALRQWGEVVARRAMESGPVGYQALAQQYAPVTADAARRLLIDAGYDAVREMFIMETALAGPLPGPAWPAGTVVRPFVLGQDERAMYDAHEEAFRDVWGRSPLPFDRFVAMTKAPSFDPNLWLLVTDGADIAATALARALPDEGWIDGLGVQRRWRRQGIGLALLRALFAAFAARGLGRAALSVDAESPSGAPRLYTRAGMTVRQRHSLFRKELRSGLDPTALIEAD